MMAIPARLTNAVQRVVPQLRWIAMISMSAPPILVPTVSART